MAQHFISWAILVGPLENACSRAKSLWSATQPVAAEPRSVEEPSLSKYMSGFMMQRGTMMICGDAAEGLGDSMYAGNIYVGGKLAQLGNDAVIKEMTGEDKDFLTETLAHYGLSEKRDITDFKKIGSGGRLHNFSKADFELWRVA